MTSFTTLKDKIFAILTVLLMLSLSYFLLNSVIAKETSDLINPFIADKDSCGDSKDDDGDGYVDDNCGTMSLNVKHNMSGAVSNITSICHEDCHIDGPEEDDLE
jgi:hypothetical protein